jgi:MoaA/NifB/PqqE/SkfB family radical SAM enzyme
VYQRLGLYLTDRCQLDCDHCLRDPGDGALDLEFEVVQRVLPEARTLYGLRHVSLTGGEPTLHPRFLDVIDTIADHGFVWDMVTNGRRFAVLLGQLQQRPARRAALRSVSFSLDGASAQTHDSIRGQGSYQEVLSAISVAVAASVPFGVQMAVHARNEAEIEQLGLFAAELGAKHVSFCWTQPTGTAVDATLRLSGATWVEVRERIERLGAALKVQVVMPEGFPREGTALLCGPVKGETLHVDVRGRLSLCCMHAGVPGPSEAAVAGHVGELGLVEANRRLLPILSGLQLARLDTMESGGLNGEWGQFACNWCLAHFGRPHWNESGTGGAAAERPRWRGPARTNRRLSLVPSVDKCQG